jgi:hypothetical protein
MLQECGVSDLLREPRKYGPWRRKKGRWRHARGCQTLPECEQQGDGDRADQEFQRQAPVHDVPTAI